MPMRLETLTLKLYYGIKTYSFDSVIKFYVQGDVDERYPICLVNNARVNRQILRALLVEEYVDLTDFRDNLIFYPDEDDIPDLEMLTEKYGITSGSDLERLTTRMSL